MGRRALADLLGADFSLAQTPKLDECHAGLLAPKAQLFTHLTPRWRDRFNARLDVRLYDLTSPCVERTPPFPEADQRPYGDRRDQRPDCVPGVMALIVTPEGLPLADEVLAGNPSDKTTRKGFWENIEQQYGQAARIWGMDRGIPTEEVWAQMRPSQPKVFYLVGTPKGRLRQREAARVDKPWQLVRAGVQVKLLPQDAEL